MVLIATTAARQLVPTRVVLVAEEASQFFNACVSLMMVEIAR
jgi:hypothetical protein